MFSNNFTEPNIFQPIAITNTKSQGRISICVAAPAKPGTASFWAHFHRIPDRFRYEPQSDGKPIVPSHSQSMARSRKYGFRSLWVREWAILLRIELRYIWFLGQLQDPRHVALQGVLKSRDPANIVLGAGINKWLI